MFRHLCLLLFMTATLQSAVRASLTPRDPSPFSHLTTGVLATTTPTPASAPIENSHQQSIATDAQPSEPRTNPWLIIIIGFLLVTGTLLYLDPKIF